MTVRISSAVARAACDNINAKLDAGATGGKLNIYAGARPANVDTSIGAQTLLVSFALPKPSFGVAVDTTDAGTATANAIDPVQAAASGTATFFRAFDANNLPIFDGTVTDTAGAGDLKLSSTSVLVGIDVTVVSLTTSMPKGA